MPAVRSAPSATRRDRKKAEPSAPCIVCGRVLNRASDMKRHLNTHGPRTHFCPEANCRFSSHTASGLKVHTDGHAGANKQCPDCSYACHDPSSFYRHRVTRHQYKPRQVARKARKPKEHVPSCVPMAVRRTISAQEGMPRESYTQFASFPMGSTSSSVSTPAADTLSDLSDLSDVSDSDTDSSRSVSPTPSYSSSSSSDFSLPDISVIQRENAARASRRIQYMTSDHQYFTLEMLADLKIAANTQQKRGDSKVECQTAIDQAYPQFPSYTVQSAPGYQAIGFKDSDYLSSDIVIPSVPSDDMDVSMLEESLTIDPALLSVDEYLATASMIDNAFWPTSYPLLKAEHADENIPLMTFDAFDVAGHYDGCYTNVAVEQEIPWVVEVEECPFDFSTAPAYFNSWVEYLEGPLTPTDEVVSRPAADENI
ncbi:hypothetical protein CVT25_013658 [Psilocybe cyanescens]|uniref:C2H2-type domain-containing protein n=1 Tax=Psilocybe cyanescens TaxID=93625 RepID=A0A409WTK7_PSICY|nr:hypothetical protein CVT25_013658 [Psilocybe cyanescens]